MPSATRDSEMLVKVTACTCLTGPVMNAGCTIRSPTPPSPACRSSSGSFSPMFASPPRRLISSSNNWL